MLPGSGMNLGGFFYLWKNISHIVEKSFPNNVVNGITRVGKLRKNKMLDQNIIIWLIRGNLQW